MIDLKTASSKEIASYFSHEVNNFCFNPIAVAKEVKASHLMKDLDLCWIKILSDPAYRTDLRNEKSALIGRQLAEIPFIAKKIAMTGSPKMEEAAQIMATDHRTLQQTFSGLVFYHFMITCNKKESQTLLKVMGDSFYKLPLI